MLVLGSFFLAAETYELAPSDSSGVLLQAERPSDAPDSRCLVSSTLARHFGQLRGGDNIVARYCVSQVILPAPAEARTTTRRRTAHGLTTLSVSCLINPWSGSGRSLTSQISYPSPFLAFGHRDLPKFTAFWSYPGCRYLTQPTLTSYFQYAFGRRGTPTQSAPSAPMSAFVIVLQHRIPLQEPI